MMCMNQCDYPGDDGEPCRCEMDAMKAFDSKLKAVLDGSGSRSEQRPYKCNECGVFWVKEEEARDCCRE